jgi:hypothetical protein
MTAMTQAPDAIDERPELVATAEPEDGGTAPKRAPGQWFERALLPAAALLWIAALLNTDRADIGGYGLLSAFPWTMYAAFGLLIVSFALTLRRGLSVPLLAAHVCLLVLMLHASPIFIEGNVRYAWSWKHLGLVDYYNRHGTPDPGLRELRVYQNWPGFFVFMSAFTRALGLDNARPIALWSPPVFQLLNILALQAVFGLLTKNVRVIWLSIWFFVVANWVGQEYFSPQAMSLFLYLVTLAVVLRAFGTGVKMPRWAQRSVRVTQAFVIKPGPLSVAQRRGYAVITALLVAAIAVSHPLTPIVLVVTLTLLTVFRAVRSFWIPLGAAAATVGWMLSGARSIMIDQGRELWSEFGMVTANAGSNIGASRLNAEQQNVALAGRAVVVLIGLLAVAGFIRAWRAGRWELAAALMVVGPSIIIVGGAYGGEVLFRVFLFALPFLAFLAACGIYAAPMRGAFRLFLVLGLSATLLVGTLFAYYGKEQWYYFTNGEVRAAEILYRTGRPGSVIVEGSPNYPNRSENYERFTYVPISREPADTWKRILKDPVDTLQDWLSDRRYTTGYLIITRAQKAEMDAIGPLPPGSLDKIERALASSNQFKVLYHDDDAFVVTVAPTPDGRTP